jgi:serine/threonine protein kinase
MRGRIAWVFLLAGGIALCHVAGTGLTSLAVQMKPCSEWHLLQQLYAAILVPGKSARSSVLTCAAYLPLQNVVHADIKPENIMFSGPSSTSVLKLIDFGLSSFVGCGAEPGGTPEFLAPEILQVSVGGGRRGS